MSEQLPATFDVSFIRGDDYELDVIVKADGTAIDFTNHSNERLQLRANGEVVEEFKASDGSLVTTSAGRVRAEFEAADTKNWPEEIVYDLESENGVGDLRTYMRGIVKVKPDITR